MADQTDDPEGPEGPEQGEHNESGKPARAAGGKPAKAQPKTAKLAAKPAAALAPFECSMPWSPTLVVEAADRHEAREEYLRRCNVISTPHPVKVTEVDDG